MSMRPRIVGYGAGGRAPPNSITACFDAFDGGADAVAVDVCETRDGVLVVGNRRTLRVLAPRATELPAWAEVKDADLGAVFDCGPSRHRLARLEDFLSAMGPTSIFLVVGAGFGRRASMGFEAVVRARPHGETSVVAPPGWLASSALPERVPRVALLRDGVEVGELGGVRADAVAMPARSLCFFGRSGIPKVALHCDTRPALLAARTASAVAVLTERPAWLRCAWSELDGVLV